MRMPILTTALVMFFVMSAGCGDEEESTDTISTDPDCEGDGKDSSTCNYKLCLITESIKVDNTDCSSIYYDCYEAECPLGQPVSDADVTALDTCYTDYDTCLSNGGQADTGPREDYDCVNALSSECDILACNMIKDKDDECDSIDDGRCDNVILCFEQYMEDCYEEACPPGVKTDDVDFDVASECFDQYHSCVAKIPAF